MENFVNSHNGYIRMSVKKANINVINLVKSRNETYQLFLPDNNFPKAERIEFKKARKTKKGSIKE